MRAISLEAAAVYGSGVRLGGSLALPQKHRYNSSAMTSEYVIQELDRHPFVPLRLHLSSGRDIDIRYHKTAWIMRQNTIVIVHPLARGTCAIGNYDVIALPLIERIEQLHKTDAA